MRAAVVLAVFLAVGCTPKAPKPSQMDAYMNACKSSRDLYKTVAACKQGFVPCAALAREGLLLDAKAISTVWSGAIQARRDFNVALGLYMGTCAGYDQPQARSEALQQISKLAGSTKQGEPRVEAYLTLSQIGKEVETPSGSLMTFNQRVSGLKSSLERQLELVRLQEKR